MSCPPVNFTDLLSQTGGDQRLAEAASDAMDQALKNLDPAIRSEVENSLLKGDSLTDLLDAANLVDSFTGMKDKFKSNISEQINLIPDSLPGPLGTAQDYTGKAENALDLYNNVTNYLDAMQQPQDIGSLPGTLQHISTQLDTTANFMGTVADLLGGVPHSGAQIASGSMKALSEFLKIFSGKLKEEVAKIAEGLEKGAQIGQQPGEVIPPGYDWTKQQHRDCMREFVDNYKDLFEDEEDHGNEKPIPPEDDNGNNADGPFIRPNPMVMRDPLVVDLNGDGVQLTPVNEPPVYFAYENSSIAMKTAWVSPDDGIIVRDMNENGKIDDSSEFFGTRTLDAFTHLSSFDNNGDNVIDHRDSIWQYMRLWQDLNQNGTTDAGELTSLASAGITGVSLDFTKTSYGAPGSVIVGSPEWHDSSHLPPPLTVAGSVVAGMGNYLRADGSTGEAWAVFFNTLPSDSRIAPPDGYVADSLAHALPDLRGGGHVRDLSVAMSIDPALKAQVQNLADNALQLSGAEFRAQFEGMLSSWLDAPVGSTEMIEKLMGTELIFSRGGSLLIEEIVKQYNYDKLIDSLLLRFVAQLSLYEMITATTTQEMEAAANSPYMPYTEFNYHYYDGSLTGWPGLAVVNIAMGMPQDKLQAFHYLDKAMPPLRAFREETFGNRSVLTLEGDRKFNEYLYRQTVGFHENDPVVFDDKGLGLFAYYRTLVSTVVKGTAGNDVLDHGKSPYLDFTKRDYTYFFGKEGDDTFVSRPYIGPEDPNDPASPTIHGTQQGTIFLYRQGDGNDTIDFSQATGKHLVFLADIDSTQASFQIDPTNPGTLLLTVPGGSITFQGWASNPLGRRGDYSLELWFADDEVFYGRELVGNHTDQDDTILGHGRIYYDGDDVNVATSLFGNNAVVSEDASTFSRDFLFGGLGDDTLIGGAGNDTYVFRRGDGNDTIYDSVVFTSVKGENVTYGPFAEEDYLNLQGFTMSEAVFTRTGADNNDLLITFTTSPGDSITILNHFLRTHPETGDPAPVITQFRFEDGVTDDTGTQIPGASLQERFRLEFFSANGNDTLSGGAGDDAYIRHPQLQTDDIIDEQGDLAGTDILRLEEAASAADVIFTRIGDDVRIDLPHGGSITLRDQMAASGTNALEYIHFARIEMYSSHRIPLYNNPHDFGILDYKDLYLEFPPADPAFDELFDSRWNQFSPVEFNYIQRLEGMGASGSNWALLDQWTPAATAEGWWNGSQIPVNVWTAVDLAAHFIPVSGTQGTITGTAAGETLTGTALDETLDGGAGDDVLIGGAGSDLYVFTTGSGNDIIRENGEFASRSVDRLELRNLSPAQGLNPPDVEFTRVNDDLKITILATGETLTVENHFASSKSAIEYVIWGDGTEWRPEHIADATRWRGDAGDNVIDASDLNDTIIGGPGNDTLRGHAGRDSYVFVAGDGNDIIEDNSQNDQKNAIFLTDIPRSHVWIERDGTTNDAILYYGGDGTGPGGTSDSIRLVNQMHPDETLRPIQFVITNDGKISIDDLAHTVYIEGTTGNDVPLVGTLYNDIIDGLAGDDELRGDRGRDTYLWGAGSGNDTIYDINLDEPSNVVRLVGLNLNDITFSRPAGSQDLVLTNTATGETLTIVDQFSDHAVNQAGYFSNTPYYRGVAVLQTEDGTTLNRAELMMQAPLRASSPGQVLNGGRGDDVYAWGSGDGDVIISDSGRQPELNMLLLDGLLPQDVEFLRDGDGYDLLVRIIATGETLRLDTQLADPQPYYPSQIKSIHFADGSSIDPSSFTSLPFTGTAAAEEVYGSYDDDTIIGGAGDDLLMGEEGGDIYLWSPGEGNDTILEETEHVEIGSGPPDYDYTITDVDGSPADGGIGLLLIYSVPLNSPGDVLDLQGVSASQVTFQRATDDTDDLLVIVGSETIRVTNQFRSPLGGVEEIRTSDQTFTHLDIMNQFGGLNVVGTTGDDELYGTWGADTFSPGAGNDVIVTRGGNDTIVIAAGGGVDEVWEFVGGPGGTIFQLQNNPFADFTALLAAASQVGEDVQIDLGGGDQLYLHRTLLSDLEAENFGFARPPVVGSAGTDWMAGTLLDDIMDALAGNDTLLGRDGDDHLNGGADDDLLDGDVGDDTLLGGDGDDLLKGGAGNDIMDGGVGIDTVDFSDETGSAGVVVNLQAGTATDTHGGADTLNSIENAITGGNDDLLVGCMQDNLLDGGDGADSFYGGDGADLLMGGGGNDWLYGQGGADLVQAGPQDDAVFGEDGDDDLQGGSGNDAIDGGIGNDIMRGDAGDDWLFGQQGDDNLQGGIGADVLFGGDGADILAGGAGSDSLDGGLLDDTLNGDDGADWLYGQDGDDTLDGGADVDALFGGIGNDTLQGGAGNDGLYGGDGDDLLDGGEGNADALTGGAGADTFHFAAPDQGGDVILDFTSGEDVIGISAAGFGLSTTGALPASMFETGAGLPASFSASGPVFYYETGFGGLWFDPTGGSSADVVIVTGLHTGVLAHTDIELM